VATQEPAFEEILSLAEQLTPGQKLRLIEAIVPGWKRSGKGLSGTLKGRGEGVQPWELTRF
jgi:hypothetical protein